MVLLVLGLIPSPIREDHGNGISYPLNLLQLEVNWNPPELRHPIHILPIHVLPITADVQQLLHADLYRTTSHQLLLHLHLPPLLYDGLLLLVLLGQPRVHLDGVYLLRKAKTHALAN